jgi:predicted metal-dependent hydrolase
MSNPTLDECGAAFKLEVAKRRRAFEYARSNLKDAQQALDDAKREYGETQRALWALGYDD